MKDKLISWIKRLGVLAVFCYVVINAHGWYWCTYAFIHPDASWRFEEQFSNLPDTDLDKIIRERPSPRKEGAMRVWQKRHPVGQPFVAWTNTTQGK
jgi:hypothetical protein